MSQFQSCQNSMTSCGMAFFYLERNYNNPILCPNPEMCIDKFKPSDEAGLVLYNAVTSCYSMDPQCMPSSGSGSGSGSGLFFLGSGSGSGSSSGCGSTLAIPSC